MRTSIIWTLFIANALITAIALQSIASGFDPRTNQLLYLGAVTLPVIFMTAHAIVTSTLKRGVFLISIAFVIGLIAEVVGMRTGLIFGGYYQYLRSTPGILGVPITVPFFWAVFIYTGYSVTNSFLKWLGKEKPNFKKGSLLTLLLFVLIDAFIVVTIDLFLDPIEVWSGSWLWITKGSYWGIPLGNFLGWFLVAGVVSLIYRTFEYLKPIKQVWLPDFVHLMPVIGYGMVSVGFWAEANRLNIPNLGIIAILVMMPIVLVNHYLYMFHKR